MSKHQAFVDYFTHEFMEELWYLQKLARGDIPKRKEADPWETFFNVTQALLSLAPIPGLPLGFLLSKELVKKCIEYGGKALALVQTAQGVGKNFLDKVDEAQGLYDTWMGKPESKGLWQPEKEGPMDLVAIRVLVELLGRGLAERYEHVLTEYLDDPAADSQVPLARVAARRIFEYLQSEPLLKQAIGDNLLAQRSRLLNGVLLGKIEKSWRERLVDTLGKPLPRLLKELSQVELPLRSPFKDYLGKTDKFTAEGVLTHCAWYDAKQIYSHAETEWLTPEGKSEQPKYGYAYLATIHVPPVKDLKRDTRSCVAPPRDWRYYHTVTVKDIQDYLESAEVKAARAAKKTASMSFHDFLSKRKLKALQAVCHDDLTAIKDWSFGNFSGVDFSGAKVTGDVSGASFAGAYLVGVTAAGLQCAEDAPVDFSGASLGFADFRGAKLPKAQFTQANLSLTNLSGADLTAIQSDGTNWYKTDLSGVKREDLWKKQAEQVKAAQAEFQERMHQLDDRMNVLESKMAPMRQQLKDLEEQKPRTETEIQALADQVSALHIQLMQLANSDFVESCTAELQALRRDVDEVRGDVGVLRLDVGEIKAHLTELEARFKDQVTVTLTKAGDVGRKILAEQTAVQLSHHVKELEFYLPPTVIDKLPEKLALDELMAALNHPQPAETKTRDPEQGLVEDKKGETAAPIALPQRFDAIEVIDTFLTAEESLLLLLGEPGAGKSLSVWQATRRLLARFQPGMSGEAISGCWLPVIIELNQFKVSELEGLIDRELKKNYGLDEKAIAKLKQTTPDHQTPEPKVLLLLDGYDELSQEAGAHRREHSELFKRIGGLKWRDGQLKVIVTCRRRFLAGDSEERMIFGVGRYQRYQRYELLPFTQEQISRYVTARSEGDKGGGLLKPAVYFSALQESESVHHLVSNPFVLQLFLESLPRLKQDRQDISDLSRFVLYRAFFDQWIEREVRRLPSIKKAVLGRDSDVTLVKDFQRMAKYLAMSLYAQNRLTVQFKPQSGSGDYEVWKALLAQVKKDCDHEYTVLKSQSGDSVEDIFGLSATTALPSEKEWLQQALNRANQLTEMLPLSRSGDAYKFVHKSFYEYLVTASIVELTGEDKPLQNALLEFFKHRLIQTEPAVLNFLHDLMSKNRNKPDQARRQALSQALYTVVERSRDEPQLGQASSNAATILNYCNISLTHRAWAGVQLAGADLSYSVLWGSDLSHANLKDADIRHALWREVKLIGANLTGVSSGERPWIRCLNSVWHSPVYSVAFHPRQPWLAVAQRESIALVDYEAGVLIGVFGGHTSDVTSVAFSPDGEYLASGAGNKICRLWKVESQEPWGKLLIGHTDAVMSVVFSPDGEYLASGSYDKSCRLWEVKSQTPVGKPLTGHTDSVNSVAFSPDGRLLASGSRDMSCRLWVVESQMPLGKPLTEHTDVVLSVTFSPDGRLLASGSWDKSCRLWEVKSQTPVGKPLTGHVGGVQSVAFSPDGESLASGSYDQSCRLWAVKSQTPLGKPLTGHTRQVHSVAFSSDGEYLASGSADESCRLWVVKSQIAVDKPLTGHVGAVLSVAFSPDSEHLASGSHDGNCRLWEVKSQMPLLGKSLGKCSVHSVVFSPDGKYLASGSADDSCWLWEVKSQILSSSPMRGHTKPVMSVAFSPDGNLLASGSRDNSCRLWEIKSQTAWGNPLTGHTDAVFSVAFSPDGGLLASGSEDNSCRLWNVQSQVLKGNPLRGHTKIVTSVAFSPDGRLLASGSRDTSCRLWNVQSQVQEGKPLEHENCVISVAFSPDGKHLASGSGSWEKSNVSGGCCLWEIATQTCIATLNWTATILSVAFQPTKNSVSLWQLAIGDSFGLISFWQIDRQSLRFHLLGVIRSEQMQLDVTNSDFSDCVMSALTTRLFTQRGGEMDGAKIVEIKESEKDEKKGSGVKPVSASTTASTSSSSSSLTTTLSSSSTTSIPSTSALQQKLRELCEEKNYEFVSKCPQPNSLAIQFTAADSALAADDKEIKKELFSLVQLLQSELTALGVSAKQYRVKPNWKEWILEITAEAPVLDKIAGVLQTAGLAYFPSVAQARAALFYHAKPTAASKEDIPTVMCALQ